jgi:hypothetical protein
MKRISVLFCMLICTISYGQYDTAQVTKLLYKVQTMQVVDDKFYDAGLFKTQREWKGRMMEDNTFFYTASLTYILQQLKSEMTNENEYVIDAITSSALSKATKYANRRGEASFNFWQTNPDTPHPNGKPKHQQSKYGLPDDLDDSAIIASVLENDSISRLLREKMVAYATSHNHIPIKKAPKDYQDTDAYRTWFADKWTQDIDVVVLCNVLLFVFENDYELNQYDVATIDFIKKVITAHDHMLRAKEISPYYGRPAVILYHLARTIQSDKQGLLQSIKAQTIADLESLLQTTENEYERMMVATSLFRLGENPDFTINENELRTESESFYFFYSTSDNISLPQYKLKLIKTLHLVPNMYWKCEAFNAAILLEFLVVTGYSLNVDFL